ncbi:MAG: MFS transporter [Actinobacteria bacterium]|nr:MFS transporter [Actinomycetota bacterium]MBO0817311.1 MFS transporter [Actinomycetota bacterium]
MAGKGSALGRDFWLYFSGQLISQVGSSFTLFALPLLVFRLTGSATDLALTTAANFVPYLLFGLVLGAVVDRLDRRRMMLLTDVARAGVIAVLPVLAVTGALRVPEIYAVAFVQSALGIVFSCGQFAAIPSLVDRERLVAANARIMATDSGGRITGPILAGILVTLMSPADLLFVDAASFLASAVSLAVIRRSFNAAQRPAPAGAGVAGLVEEIRSGLRYVWSHPVLRSISLMMALINFVGATERSQLVLFGKRALGASDSQVALLFAAGAAGVLLVSMAAAPIRRRVSFAVTALGALVVSGLAVTAMAVLASYPAALVLWAVSSGFGLLLNINTNSLRQAIVPDHLYGRVISIAGVLAWSAIPLGALAGAAAIRWSGSVTDVYAVSGTLTALIALSFAVSPVRHGDRHLAAAASDD